MTSAAQRRALVALIAVLLAACRGLGGGESGPPVSAPEASVSAPEASLSTPAVSADEAIAAARISASELADYDVLAQRHTLASELHPSFIAMDVPGEREVWYLVFNNPAGEEGAFVIVDSNDGSVLEVIDTIE